MAALPSSRPPKPPIEVAELSQILAHARDICEAVGPWRGTVILLVAIIKSRQGFASIAATVSIVGGIIYHSVVK